MDNPEIIQKKLMLYEKFFDEMREIEQEEIKIFNNSQNKNIEENYIYLDETRDFTDLNLKDQKIINEQNNLHNYHQFKTKFESVKDIYTKGKYLMYISKWIPFY